MTHYARKQRGQALVMVSMALFAMLGIIGLVVDLGWAYYTKKSAQAAADAAALAAVQKVPVNGPYICGASFTCQDTMVPCTSPAPSPAVTNLDSGCRYAELNGFATGGTQTVTFVSGVNSTPPTAPGVVAYYWATARVSRRVPQLFSFILGNRTATSSARATAAVVDILAPASLYALNRENDKDSSGNFLVDIDGQGGGYITASGGVYMASTASGIAGNYAGLAGGSFQLQSSFTDVRDTGLVSDPTKFVNLSGQPNFKNGFDDGPNYMDPMRDKGQPPAPTMDTAIYDRGVLGGTIFGDCDNPPVLQPGYYYAYKMDQGSPVATGDSIRVSGCVTFASGTGWGDYVFFGGVVFSTPHSVVTFGPGRYILAGAQPGNKLVEDVFSESNGTTLQDMTPLVGGKSAPNTNAGEIFIFTDANYPGLRIPELVRPIMGDLKFGPVDIQMGNDSNAVVNLHGLNRKSPDVPAETNAQGTLLKDFAPVVFWQDQQNSTIKYTADGNIDYSADTCGPGHDLSNPCTTGVNSASTIMTLQAHPNLHLYGTIYQPRGATLDFNGHGTLEAPVQVITGRVAMQGSPTIIFDRMNDAVSRKLVALVE